MQDHLKIALIQSDLIWENHAKAYKSWKIPIDWVSIPNEEVIDVILGDE